MLLVVAFRSPWRVWRRGSNRGSTQTLRQPPLPPPLHGGPAEPAAAEGARVLRLAWGVGFFCTCPRATLALSLKLVLALPRFVRYLLRYLSGLNQDWTLPFGWSMGGASS